MSFGGGDVSRRQRGFHSLSEFVGNPSAGYFSWGNVKGLCQREESGDSLAFMSQDGEQDAVCGGTIFEGTHGSEFRYTIQCYKLHLMLGEQVRRKASSR